MLLGEAAALAVSHLCSILPKCQTDKATAQVTMKIPAMTIEAGHQVQIFLLAEATTLMRKSLVNVIQPVGWPALSETMEKIVAKHIPIFA